MCSSARCLALLWALLASTVALGQAPSARFSLGVAGQPVADAWNPLRLELRDAPPATLTLQIDQGTLRSGELPLTVSHAVRGGAGISVFETTVYLPRFARLAWRLATPDRVLASGSVEGREADARPLDLLLSNLPGSYRAAYATAYGPGARLADVVASDLPSEPAAYDGVRTLLIDGSAAAPRLESVAAAAAGGATVVLLGPLPPSHAELELLLAGGAHARLGAGAVVASGAGPETALTAAAALATPARDTLLAALLEEPLVAPPTPAKQSLVALALAAFALLALLLVRWAGAPGLVGVLALVALVSVVGWRALRPATPQLERDLTLALAGDGLALEVRAREVLTLPRSALSYGGRARPLRPQPYRVDDAGTHLTLERWRAAMLEFAPRLADAPLLWDGEALRNVGREPVRDLVRVGAGPLGDLAPGASAPTPTEAGDWPRYAALLPLLPDGTVVGRSACDDACTVWVLYPPAAVDAAAGAGEAPPARAATPLLTAPSPFVQTGLSSQGGAPAASLQDAGRAE